MVPASVPGPDLWLSPEVKKGFPFIIECKNQEKLNIWDALKQAEEHLEKSGEGEYNYRIPAVFFKRNNSELFVAMRAEDLFVWKHFQDMP